MQVTLQIPDFLADQFLSAGEEATRAAVEVLAVEAYRMDALSEGELRDLLGYETPMQFHELLKRHGAYIHYSVEDFEQDKATLLRLRASAVAA